MGEIFAALIGGCMLLLYIFLAWRFTANSLRALLEYYKRERRPYEILPGTIVDFELRRISHPRRSGKQTVFYPVFEYQWKGKTHRQFHRRVMATFGPGLKPVPATRLKIGDPVQVRLFPSKPSDTRIEEAFYFWKSRIWGHLLVVSAGCAMMLCGIWSAIRMLLPNI